MQWIKSNNKNAKMKIGGKPSGHISKLNLTSKISKKPYYFLGQFTLPDDRLVYLYVDRALLYDKKIDSHIKLFSSSPDQNYFYQDYAPVSNEDSSCFALIEGEPFPEWLEASKPLFNPSVIKHGYVPMPPILNPVWSASPDISPKDAKHFVFQFTIPNFKFIEATLKNNTLQGYVFWNGDNLLRIVWALQSTRPFNMWDESERTEPFLPADFEKYFQNKTLTQMLDSSSSPELRILKYENGSTVFLPADGKAFQYHLQRAKVHTNLDLDKNPKYLSWFIVPAMFLEGMSDSPQDYGYDLFMTEWGFTDDPNSSFVKLYNKNTFFDKEGYYPYKNGQPLSILANFKVDNREAYLFGDQMTSSYYAWFKNGALPEGIEKVNIAPNVKDFLGMQHMSPEAQKSFTVPVTALPQNLQTNRGTQTPPRDFPFPVLHIPASDLKILGIPLTPHEILWRDTSSIIVYWDGQESLFADFIPDV